MSALRDEFAAIELAAQALQITLVRIIIITIIIITIIISLIVLLESTFTFFVRMFPNLVIAERS